jgi:hypothetical protein
MSVLFLAAQAELREILAARGPLQVLSVDFKRYVGAQIGVFNPQGDRVGEVSHLHNVEYLVLSGERELVRRAVQSNSELTSASTTCSASTRRAPRRVSRKRIS